MKSDHKDFSRREFMTKASAGIAVIGTAGLPTGRFTGDTMKFTRTFQKDGIYYRKLGKTGLELPIVSMGVMNADNPAVVSRSYDIGVRHFDTAEGYQRGRNETMVGDVFSKLGVRDKIIIGTKIVHPNRRRRGGSGSMGGAEVTQNILERLDKCLERLKTDYVDILYLHNSGPEFMKDPAVHEAFDKAKEAGKIRFKAISTHTNMQLELNQAAEMGYYDVVLTSYNFTHSEDTKLANAIENAASKGIGLIAMKTQVGGERRYKKPVNHTATLKWALRNELMTTAIPGYTNFDHMNEDFSVASNLEFTADEKKFLADKDVKTGLNYCRQCGECTADCEKGVDVPSLMRTHMYAAGYANFFQAGETMSEIDPSRGLSNCSDCTECRVRCRYVVDVPANINDLRALYV